MKKWTLLVALLVLAANTIAQDPFAWSRSAASFVPDDSTPPVDYNITSGGAIKFEGSKTGDLVFFGSIDSHPIIVGATFCLQSLDTGPNTLVEAKLFAKSKFDGASALVATVTSTDLPTVHSDCVGFLTTINQYNNDYYVKVRLNRSVGTANVEFHLMYVQDPA